MTGKKTLALPLALVLALFLAACGGGNVEDVTVDYAGASRETTQEINQAVEVVKREFQEMEGCTLHSLSYAGDERSAAELDYTNKMWGNPYNACIVLNSSFHSPKEGGDAWEADTEYTWSWVVARETAGNWVLVNCGYG